MKLSTKIILPIILISALLILLAGCFGVPADESPGYTPGTITGIIAAPCCSTSAEPVSETSGAPEYWCYYCQETWSLQDGIEVVLTYGEDKVDTTTTNQYGEFTFTDVSPGKNYVITAYCPDYDDNRPLVKDVALELIEGGSFDTKITDLVSTSLGLVVDFLVLYTEWGPEDISLDEVLADRPGFPNFPKFKKLVYEVRRVLEICQNVNTDDDVQDALCRAAEEISKLEIGCGPGYTPPPPPPPTPNPCAGNIAPTISSVLLDGTAVSIGETVSAVVGTSYVVTVNATDDGIADPLTYSATINGNPVGTVASNVITVTPLVAGTFEVYVHVNDGCTTTTWGPVTVVVECPPITADAGEDQSEEVCPGADALIDLVGSGTGTGTLSYSWDYDNGGSNEDSTEQSPQDVAFGVGTYIVTLTVTDDCGSTTDTMEVEVTESAGVTAYAGPDQSEEVCPGADALIDLTGSGTGTTVIGPLSYSWDYDNDSTEDSAEQSPQDVAFGVGIHTVTLTVTDDCGSTTDTMTVTITESATVTFTISAVYDFDEDPPDCSPNDTSLWWHEPCGHTQDRDYVRVEVTADTNLVGADEVVLLFDQAKIQVAPSDTDTGDDWGIVNSNGTIDNTNGTVTFSGPLTAGNNFYAVFWKYDHDWGAGEYSNVTETKLTLSSNLACPPNYPDDFYINFDSIGPVRGPVQ